jgi:hypothetical protein
MPAKAVAKKVTKVAKEDQLVNDLVPEIISETDQKPMSEDAHSDNEPEANMPVARRKRLEAKRTSRAKKLSSDDEPEQVAPEGEIEPVVPETPVVPGAEAGPAEVKVKKPVQKQNLSKVLELMRSYETDKAIKLLESILGESIPDAPQQAPPPKEGAAVAKPKRIVPYQIYLSKMNKELKASHPTYDERRLVIGEMWKSFKDTAEGKRFIQECKSE